MRKILHFTLLLMLVILISSCDTAKPDNVDENGKPLSFPTLEACTPELLQNHTSYICIKDENEGPSLIEVNIKFRSDSFKLDDQAKKVLNKLFAYLKLTGTYMFTIKGYSGRVDSKLLSDKKLLTEHNIRLSENRAISVREYLVKKGIEPADGIKVQALGYQDPIAPNDSNANRELNQRVEITIKSRVIDQIDTIEKRLKHLRPSDYSKFLSNVYLLNQNQLEDTARIYDSSEKRPVLATNFKIYANKQYPEKDDSSNFIIVSKPKPVSSFNTDQKVFKLGDAKYNYTYKNITALTINNLTREANVGDYVIPNDMVSQELPDETFRMTSKITANVIEDVMNTNSYSSTFNSILLNKGSSDGLKVGAEMVLYEPETRVDGFPVPPKYVGYGFVYRESDHYSILLIVNSLQEITSDAMATTIL